MQPKLFWDTNILKKKIVVDNIGWSFYLVGENIYEVFLDINWNKFLFLIEIKMNKIEKFEIIAIKWFVDVSFRLLKLLKKIVYKLYFDF